MKTDYLFIGRSLENGGPDNVNRNIKENLTQCFMTVKTKNDFLSIIETIVKMFCCKVVVASGIQRFYQYYFKMAKFLGKKTVYIMHGCVAVEARLNDFIINHAAVNGELEMLKNADLILPVSKKFSEMMQDEFPQFREKFKYLYNGVEPVRARQKIERKGGTIIAVGGDRKLKNNITVANAMKNSNLDVKLKVYGHLYNPGNLPQTDNIEFMGLVSQDELYSEMMKSELFVLDSVYEPFSLSVFDALFCGCSILVSSKVGALDLLHVTEKDIIYDPNDEKEISSKISYLLEHPNNARLLDDLDMNSISYKEQVKKLQSYCEKITS